MYIEAVPNRNSPPALLLRESYREGGKVKKRTLANLTSWSPAQVEALRQALRGSPVALPLAESFEIVRSRPHGHVAAVLGTLQDLQLDELLAAQRSRSRDLCVGMIVSRVLNPRSKLATARHLRAETLAHTLGELLDLQDVSENELYQALDWLVTRQAQVEKALARRHLAEGSLVLYDLTSVYFEGRQCPLARRGYSRDGKRDRLQIVVGLLTDSQGCPVAVEVFEGNTGDPKTLPSQINKLRQRFGLQRVTLVGDRGMITEARIQEDLQPVEGLAWITALRSSAIRQLVDHGTLQLSLFDQTDLAEIQDPAYPGERLIVCKNPLLAAERVRKREDLLQATERELDRIVAATRRPRQPLQGQDRIGLRVGKVLGRFKVQKHFRLTITDTSFSYERDGLGIAQEAALDGIYVIRTNVPTRQLGSSQVVASYKRLAQVERAFRSLKTVDLHVRPIYHRLPERVRAHVLLCMLAYYVEWHMRQALAPLLFDDDDPLGAAVLRSSIVAPAQRSLRAQYKAAAKRTVEEDAPVHSFQSLLTDLSTIVKNRIQPKAKGMPAFDMITTPTPLQQRIFDSLGVPWRM